MGVYSGMNHVELRLKCPACGRGLAKVTGMRWATNWATRKCAGCRTHWSVRVVPLDSGREVTGMRLHEVNFTALGSSPAAV